MSTKQTSKTRPEENAGPKAEKGQTKKSDQQSENKLQEFFYDELKDIYWAEKHLIKTLPKLAKASTSDELKSAFTEHLEVTKNHVARLEQVFDILGYAAQAKKCEAMEGITKEGEDIIEDTEEGTATRDVGLILAGQKTEHYEIATYGGLAQIARTLGNEEISKLLETTLAEEKEADESLSALAEGSVNELANEE